MGAEKEELQAALEEAEGALHAEENKVLRAQLELGQVKQEIDRRIAEKEEEFENTRKNHARAMDSMQASLETEQRSKAEGLRIKKKLEGEINEFEIALDHANKANNEALKSIKRYQGQLREAETQYEEACRSRQEMSERKIKELQFQNDEDRKNQDRMSDLASKLQQKIGTYKKQIEEAEEIAALNLAKFRKAQQELEETEDRARMAENALHSA